LEGGCDAADEGEGVGHGGGGAEGLGG
jgi:hypothetical protein